MITSTRVWTVKAGDKLTLIAATVYGDARHWRAIAEANNIANPLRFPGPHDLGRLLLIPGERA